MTHEEFEALGYTHLRNVHGQICALYKFLFTTGLVVDLNNWGPRSAYC